MTDMKTAQWGKTNHKPKHTNPAAALLKDKVNTSSIIRLLISNKIIFKHGTARPNLPHPPRPTRKCNYSAGGTTGSGKKNK